jgi:hypothetical protein
MAYIPGREERKAGYARRSYLRRRAERQKEVEQRIKSQPLEEVRQWIRDSKKSRPRIRPHNPDQLELSLPQDPNPMTSASTIAVTTIARPAPGAKEPGPAPRKY